MYIISVQAVCGYTVLYCTHSPHGEDLSVGERVRLVQVHAVRLEDGDGLDVPGAPHLRHIPLKVEREPNKYR